MLRKSSSPFLGMRNRPQRSGKHGSGMRRPFSPPSNSPPWAFLRGGTQLLTAFSGLAKKNGHPSRVQAMNIGFFGRCRIHKPCGLQGEHRGCSPQKRRCSPFLGAGKSSFCLRAVRSNRSCFDLTVHPPHCSESCRPFGHEKR